jgi:peroxiredoxin
MSIRARLVATFALAASLVAAPLVTGCATTRAPVERSAKVAPEMSLRLRSGGSLDAEARRGKVLVLAFFSTWCDACNEAIPALDVAARKLVGDDVLVVAVNEDESGEAVDRFVRKHRIALPIAFDGDGRLARHLELPTIPTMVVIDRAGAVRYMHAGFHGLGEVDAIEDEVVALRRDPLPADPTPAGAPSLPAVPDPKSPATAENAVAVTPIPPSSEEQSGLAPAPAVAADIPAAAAASDESASP